MCLVPRQAKKVRKIRNLVVDLTQFLFESVMLGTAMLSTLFSMLSYFIKVAKNIVKIIKIFKSTTAFYYVLFKFRPLV